MMCDPKKRLKVAEPDHWIYEDEKIEKFGERWLGFRESEQADNF